MEMTSVDCHQGMFSFKPQITTVSLDHVPSFPVLIAAAVSDSSEHIIEKETTKGMGKKTKRKNVYFLAAQFTCILPRNAAVRWRGIVHSVFSLSRLLLILQLNRIIYVLIGRKKTDK